MSILFKRLLVLLLIPAGLVLLVTPLPTHRVACMEQNYVFISASPVNQPISGLGSGLRIAGGAFLLTGIFLTLWLYFMQHAIIIFRQNPNT